MNESMSIGRSSMILPMLVVAGILLAKFVIASPAFFVFALALSIIFGLIFINRLEYGLIALMFVAAFALGESPGVQSPNSGYNAGVMPSQMILAFLTGLYILRYAFIERSQLIQTELNLPLIAIASVATLSLIVNNVLDATRKQLFHQMMITQVAEVGLLLFSICAFFMTANVMKDGKKINSIFTPVVLFGCYYAVHPILGIDMPIPVAWGSFLLTSSIAFVYSRLLFYEMSRSKRIFMGFLLVVFMYAAVSDIAWLSGMIATMTAVMVVSWFRSRMLFIVILSIMLIVLFVLPGIYWNIHSESESGGDFDRFVIWADAFNMFMGVNPLLGIGPGNYYPYVLYHNSIWFGERTYTTAHSNYTQMAAELGLLGFGVFLWVIVGGLRLGIRAAGMKSADYRWLGISATALFAGMAAASFFGDYLFPSRGNNGIVNFGTTVYTWLIMGAAAAAANLERQKNETADGPSFANAMEGKHG